MRVIKVFLLLICVFTSGEHLLSMKLDLEQETLEIDGRERIYYLYKPAEIGANVPLVFVLHGYGGSALKMMEYSKMNEVADSVGFAVCYPQGFRGADDKNSWNAGYSNPDVDDVKFLETLAVKLQVAHDLSPRNTFCTGMSNGADMSYKLACSKSDVFAAVAPVAGCMMQTTFDNCQQAEPIPIFEIHGTDDDITLWEGDEQYSTIYGGYLGVTDIFEFWSKQNLCSVADIDTLQDINTEDGSYVVTERRNNGASKNEVWLYTLVGGKHDWPGSWGNKDFVAAYEIWRFFSRFIVE